MYAQSPHPNSLSGLGSTLATVSGAVLLAVSHRGCTGPGGRLILALSVWLLGDRHSSNPRMPSDRRDYLPAERHPVDARVAPISMHP